jgi:hypothetical protein
MPRRSGYQDADGHYLVVRQLFAQYVDRAIVRVISSCGEKLEDIGLHDDRDRSLRQQVVSMSFHRSFTLRSLDARPQVAPMRPQVTPADRIDHEDLFLIEQTAVQAREVRATGAAWNEAISFRLHAVLPLSELHDELEPAKRAHPPAWLEAPRNLAH